MKLRYSIQSAMLGLLALGRAFGQTPLGTEFSYQGRLDTASGAASGLHDLRFTLHSAASGADNVIAGPICKDGVDVSAGVFTVALDFGPGGAVFNGEARWLSVEVRADATPGDCGSGPYALLTPRQALTAAPFALDARNAGRLNQQDGTFYQDAANLNNGILHDDRLSANVCLLDREQYFTDSKHFERTAYFYAAGRPFEVESNGLVTNLNADLLDGLDSSALRQWIVAGANIFNVNEGNVGIGDSSPISKLSVRGGLRVFDDLDEDVAFFTGNFSIWDADEQHLAYRYMADPEQHEFCIEGTPRMMLASSGNLGLGTTEPTALLHMKPRLDQTCIRMEADRYEEASSGAIQSTASVIQISGSGAVWINAQQAGSPGGGSATAALESPGASYETRELEFRNLGFAIPTGATIRGVTVEVDGESNFSSCTDCIGSYADIEYRTRARLANGAMLGAERNERSTGVTATLGGSNDTWGLALTPAIVNSAGFGVRVRVRMIPVSTFYDITHPNGAPFDCSGCDAETSIGVDNISVRVEYGTSTLAHAEFTVGIGPSSRDFQISPSSDFSDPAFSIDPNGVVSIAHVSGIALNVHAGAAKPGGGSWSSTSDARLKRDVQPLEGTLDRLLKLRGYSFEYTEDAVARKLGWPGRHQGLIAQEVERVFPDWIDYTPDGYRMVTERATTALLVEALRDLRVEKDWQLAERDARIAELEAGHAREIGELSARLERLESALPDDRALDSAEKR